MKKKVISILVTMSAIVAILLGSMISFANDTSSSLFVGLSKTDLDGVGYGDANPNQGGEYIWNLITHDSSDAADISDIEDQRNLYCVNVDYGETWFNTTSQKFDIDKVLEYKFSYDIQSQTDINELNQILNADSNNGLDGLLVEETEGVYSVRNEILWLLDNLYIPNDPADDAVDIAADVNTYLEKFGIEKDADGKYWDEDGNGLYSGEDPKEEDIAKDIIAVQRMAIWYFTDGINRTGEDSTAWLFIDEGDGYGLLSESRRGIALYVYNQLIEQAGENASQYVGENRITVNTENLQKEETENEVKFIAQTKLVDGKYITGPIVIEKENENPFDIELAVTNSTGSVNYDYVITDANGTPITGATVESVVANGDELYISTNTIDDLHIAITVLPTHTSKTLWLAGNENETTGERTLEGEQPIVEIEKADPETTILTVKPFDLALRKYITAVKGISLSTTDTRVPNYEGNLTSTLQTGTTADYKHRKDPVEVKDGEVITYAITIYNEGSKAGYATKIIDQLPEGLFMSNTHTNGGTVTSKDSQGNPVNTYTIEWDYLTNPMSYLNQITLTIADETNAVSLDPYTTGTELDYETIEIECIVAQEPDEQMDTILTNVAWIEEAYDSEAGKSVSTSGTVDRDSQPQTSPNVNKDMDKTMSYIGNSLNKTDLTDSSYHYAGEQDDDDFEKVVIKADPKIFDLALVKFIVAVSDDPIIEEGEYLTTTGNSDGEYLRAPDVIINQTTGEIEYNFDNKGAKEPLTVEPGDYVLYNIRVYNEGEVDGYVSLIKDTLPKGLTLVDRLPIEEQEKPYYAIWSVVGGLDSEGRQTASTDNFAKGNGADELNPGSNLLKAFNTETGITAENPDYLDAQILCQVDENQKSDTVLTNYAQIADDTDANGDEVIDDDSTPDNDIPGDNKKEDDEDFEKVIVNRFDLSLRKFITAVNGNEPEVSREPNPNTKPLEEKTDTDAIYYHPKTPLAVKAGDKIIYTIRVYNEGDINGYATEVKDYLPPYLKYIDAKDSEINTLYEWQISEDGRVATTRYLDETELNAFDSNKGLHYADLQIECELAKDVPVNENQTNIAEISKYKYKQNEVIYDSDSIGNSMEEQIPADTELPAYKEDEIDNTYVPGNEDDDDFEKIYVQKFDLALRKFITKVQETEVTTREPQVDMTPLKNGQGTATYTHPKDALTVHVGDVVTYTLRIYNEGEISGYATEITDDIPEYLEYLPEDSTNVEYMWKMYDENGNETKNVSDAVKVKTTYLSKENGENNLIKAFDGEILSYKDIKIAFKVKDPNSNTYIITNYAQISDDADENGENVEDNDSTPDKWIDNEQHKDDDQDIENVKVEYFDLSLLKFVSKVIVIEDGKETITETGYNGHENPEPVVKVELHKKKLNNVVVKFGYGITITNEGDIPGYATEITDYVPEGLKFEAADNPNWTDEGNNVISTKQLENTLLQPGESKTVEVIFTWINSPDNLAQKTNTAEISEDKNEYDVPDRDSIPDNKVEGEDDIDIAKVILGVSTGAAQTYFTLTLGLLAIVLVGIILIKKFVI